MLQRTYRFLRESSSSPQFWPSAQVVDFIDEAHSEIVLITGLLDSQWHFRTSAQVAEYPLSAAVGTPRHVLWTSAGGTYQLLDPAGIVEAAINRDFQASGTPEAWALAGTDTGVRPTIRLIPMPDHSAASAIYVIGTPTPESISTSAIALPRQVRSLVPLRAAILGWEERGIQNEVDRLGRIYDRQLKLWRIVLADLSPRDTDLATFGEHLSRYPFSTIRRVVNQSDPF